MNKEEEGAYAGKSRYSVRGGRKGFSHSGEVLCKNCFSISRQFEQLRLENFRLKQKLKKRDEQLSEIKITKKDVEAAHEPSSRRRFKKNSNQECQNKVGGAKPGHKGYGRESIDPEQADEKIRLSLQSCPDCDTKLEFRDSRDRSVLEAQPLKAKKVIYRCSRGACPKCLKIFTAKPTVFSKSFYGNSLIAQAATLHYLQGITIGKVLTMLGKDVTEGGLLAAFHRLGELCEQARPALIVDYRKAEAKHADETGWRTDGHSGYAWLFCSSQTSVFEFRNTRSAKVAKEILGLEPLKGVLVVDRYGGYNRMPCSLQYCYAHLLRDVEKLEKEFPDDREVVKFVSELATELTKAMKLRGRDLLLEEYKKEAESIQLNIEMIIMSEAKHLAIRRIQYIFRDKKHRLYHWVKSPEIPAENNRAERELRPTVIARKVSFGSQSKRGAQTRSRIMTVLATAKKRFPNQPPEDWLTSALNAMTQGSKNTLADFLQVIPSVNHL